MPNCRSTRRGPSRPSDARPARPSGRRVAEPGYQRRIVGPAAIAVQLDPVFEHPFHVVERVRTVGMPGELDRFPDSSRSDRPLMRSSWRCSRSGSPESRAPRRADAAELAQPPAQPEFGVIGTGKEPQEASEVRAEIFRSTMGQGDQTIVSAREAEVRGSFSRVVCCTTRGR